MSVTYCVLPAATGTQAVEAVRRHFAGDPSVQVLVDRRGGAREPGPVPGRRFERRRPVLRRHADPALRDLSVEGIRFEQPLPPVGALLADQPIGHVVARARSHDAAAAAELRWRLQALVADRLACRLGSPRRAARHLPAALDAVHDALPRYEDDDDFLAWAARVVDGAELRV